MLIGEMMLNLTHFLAKMIQEGNNAILLISTTYTEDSGTFSCRATSSAGQVEQSAKLIVKSRPGTFRKSATTDVTDKDEAKAYPKTQYGPGPGGVGKTTLKATPGSKGGQPLEENELPIGDETLLWRSKSKLTKGGHVLGKIPSTLQPSEDQIEKPLQAKPWIKEPIKLRKTQIENREMAKETLESVDLKPFDTTPEYTDSTKAQKND
ncbi:hypothetical protein NQ317_000713 [Molorchus minor]|uniref:Immunoglobulin I-set domain-containing protein n=1 Tax=Molorchus minor TaxID=1323400 RepID=A0ABQ9JFP3_9CUCU|nr:hypothetical protein NQ317_000713 [Molorchus minor]